MAVDEISSDQHLTVKPGDYSGVIRRGDDQAIFQIHLDGDHYPNGPVYDLPLPESGLIRDSGGKAVGARFPASERFPQLAGHLRNGLPIALLDVRLTHWVTDQAQLLAETAIVGSALDKTADLRFRRLRFQVEGLAEVIGIGTIGADMLDRATGKTKNPILVHLADDSSLKWSHSTGEAVAGFDTRISGIADPFHFEVSSSPHVSVTSEEALDWPSWWSSWVRPVHDLVCLSGRASRSVTWVTLQAERPVRPGQEEVPAWWSSAQVFGHGIRQTSHSVQGRMTNTPLFQLASSPVPLPTLVERWLEIRAKHRGFLDTYQPILHEAPLTDLARFMFLAIGAEALHAGLHGVGPRAQEEHKAERRKVLGRIKTTEGIQQPDLKFLRRFLARRNDYSLEQRIKQLVDDLGPEFAAEAQAADLAKDLPGLRNALAHGSALTSDQLLAVGQCLGPLQAVLEAHILRLLGLPTTDLATRIREER
jgi:hypothetical protein